MFSSGRYEDDGVMVFAFVRSRSGISHATLERPEPTSGFANLTILPFERSGQSLAPENIFDFMVSACELDSTRLNEYVLQSSSTHQRMTPCV